MRLETERLILRPFRQADLPDLYEYAAQPGVGEMAGWKHHACLEESRAVLEQYISSPGTLAVEHRAHAKVIGHLAVHEDSEDGREDTRELGCALHQAYQRQGIMTEAVRAILAHLFSNGIRHVYACCFQENLPSRRLIEGCGFTFEREGAYESQSLGKTFQSYEYVIHFNSERMSLCSTNL